MWCHTISIYQSYLYGFKIILVRNKICDVSMIMYGSAVCKLSIVPLVFRRLLHDRFATVELLCHVVGSDERCRQKSTPTHRGENPGLKQDNPRAISPRDKKTSLLWWRPAMRAHPTWQRPLDVHISFFSLSSDLSTSTSLATSSYLTSPPIS